MYLDLLLDSITNYFNIFNSKLKNYFPDTIRYIILLSIISTIFGLLYSTGIFNLLVSASKGNPRVSLFVVIFVLLLFMKEIYYSGKKHSYLFDIFMILFLLFLIVVYNNNKNYKYLFVYLLIVFSLYRLNNVLKTTSIEELINKYKLNEYDNLNYDILVVKDEKSCRLSGDYNKNNNRMIDLTINKKDINSTTCKNLIKDTNLNSIAKWDDIISFGGEQNIGEDCNENWWNQIYDDENVNKKNTCLSGLSCKDNECYEVNKKIDDNFL